MSTKFVLRTMVLALAGSVLVFLLVGQLLADHWKVETSRTIPFPPAKVAPLVRDLGTWQDWSVLKFQLGQPTARTVVGEPGAVGQRVEWNGPLGIAVVELVEATPESVAYTIRYRYGQDAEFGGQLGGRITCEAEGDGCKVTWSERGELPELIQRWSHWFGALQEKVRQVQGASLAGLEDHLRRGAADAAK